MWRKGNPRALLVGIWIGAATMENSKEGPQKKKNRTTIRYNNSFTGISLKEMKSLSQMGICTPTFTAVLFTITKTRKQLKCPATDKWIKKTWHIHTVEYCVCVLSCFSSVLILGDCMDYRPPDSSVHGILQASLLGWVAISSSRGSSWSKDQNHIAYISCTGAGPIPLAPSGKPIQWNVIQT